MASGQWTLTGDNLGDYATITYSNTSQLASMELGTDEFVTPAVHIGECDRLILMPYGTKESDEAPKAVGSTITLMAQFSMDGTNWSEIPSDGVSTRDGTVHNPGFSSTVNDAEMGWLDYNAKYLRFRHEPKGTNVPANTVLNLVVYKQYFGKNENKRRR